MKRSLQLLPMLALLASCGGAEPPAEEPAEVDTFNPEQDLNLDEMTRTDSGLHYLDLLPGTGETAIAGRQISVHYTGWLTDGTKFDSSRDRGDPFVMPLGAGHVISGWDEGLEGMRVGGKRRLVIPPELAYGDRGAGTVIPPGATLVFEVELLEVR